MRVTLNRGNSCLQRLICLLCLASVLLDTTRLKKSHEREGVEYNFVSKQSFEMDVQQNK